MPSIQPVLSTRGLSKDYPGMRALDGLDLDLLPGEIHGVVGANGAGKSTVIRLLSGLQEPSSGVILIDGEPVSISSVSTAESLGISVVHQELPLLPNLTAAQNMVVGRERSRLLAPARKRRDQATYRRAAAGLPGAPAPASRLETHGLYAWQMVAIVRATADAARVLILDEPTSSLTVDERNALHERVRALAANGLSVLYVSHFLDDILDVASTVSVLRDGRLVHRGPTVDLDEESLLAHMTSGTGASRAGDVTVQPLRSASEPSARTSNAGGQGLVLDDLNVGEVVLPHLAVRPGEIVGLYGLEDSGARDVVESVFGLRPRTGSVRWAGHSVKANPRDAISRGITLVTGDRKRAGIASWSVEMNHALPRLSQRPLLAPAPRRSMRRETERSIQEFRVKGRAGQRFAGLSGGNQQKLLLARWIGTAPVMCMLLDEPTHGVDVGGRRAIYDQLREFAARGNAVLLHSTDPEEVVELCDRAIPFASGRPLEEIPRDDLDIDALEHAVRASTRHQSSDLEVTP
ncbi:sugar ABC transporter ATP-binding protein [Nocardioides sp. J54]|uniref:sugar ABC transporter ATP-binding protein n=1 Tax=Nocardioides sp. J54 TaxID=935866 RepID=UPI001E375336|nr:sugar ABC transporter ATP-binding protein [Nocardioides sp. J54]